MTLYLGSRCHSSCNHSSDLHLHLRFSEKSKQMT
jgi:hypothetical protein